MLVFGLVQILRELGLDLLADGVLLRLDEGVQQDSDGEVDVVTSDVLSEVHLGGCLRHSQNGLDVSDSDAQATGTVLLLSELVVEV